MEILTLFYVILLGMLLGSFTGLAVVRIPLRESLWTPRSHCRHCKHTLSWYENIPLISFLALGARCRHCKSSIGFRYWMIECTMTLLTVGAYLTLSPWTRFLLWELAFILPMVLLVFLDWKEKILPDAITLPGIALGFLTHWAEGRYFSGTPWPLGSGALILESLWGAVAGGVTLYLVAAIYKWLRGHMGMGGGDIKLGAMIGAFFGWKAVFFIFFIASVTGTLYGLIMILMKRHSRSTQLPFGSFLGAAAILYLFYGAPMLQAYLGIFKMYR